MQLHDENQSTMKQSVQTHLEVTQMVRDQATSKSHKAAEYMIKKFSSKHPPAQYAIGSQVLVRRFSSKCRKRAGNKSAGKSTRIVKGTIVDRNLRNGTYKICYFLMDREVDEWFKISNITSLTHEEENKKHIDRLENEEKMSIDQLPFTAQPLTSSSTNDNKTTPSSEESSLPSSSKLLSQSFTLSSSLEEKPTSLQPTGYTVTFQGITIYNFL